jgi:hypothetical protein
MASEPLKGEECMLAGERWISGPKRVFYFAILIPLLGVPGTASQVTGPDSGIGTIAALAVGSMQSKLVFLQPGLLIGDKPPEDWSHLVLKSKPRLTSGDVHNLPKEAAKTAAYFRTVILANVKPVDVDEKDFELTQIGIGICVPRKGQDEDVVVSADRLDALGLHLSMVEKVVLDSMEAEMAKGRIIARTPTFALFRSPAMVVAPGNEHRNVNLNYAFCVERTTGKLQVGLWTSSLEKKELRAPQTMSLLDSKSVFDCKIDVRSKKVFGVTVPLMWSFAMSELPPGRPVSVPAELGKLITITARNPNDGNHEELERLLGQRLATVTVSDKSIRRTAIPPPLRRE